MKSIYYLIFVICMVFFGCSDLKDDPTQEKLSGNVFVYQAYIDDAENEKSYTIEGELTLQESQSEIRLLSYDGGQWKLKIRKAENSSTEQGVIPFYIDLQSITRNDEVYMVHGAIYNSANDNYNGFYYSGTNERIEFSYISTQNNKSVRVTVMAAAKSK